MAGNPEKIDVARLVTDHHAVLYRYAYRLTGSAADAEDLTQQVFLVVQSKIHQLREFSNPRGWMFAILRNCYLASRRKRSPLLAGSVGMNIDAIPEKVPSDDEIDREQLQTALDALPDDLRMVLVMFYFEGCSYREIAERLEVPAGTVMSRLSRAKGYMRAKLIGSSPQVDDRRIRSQRSRNVTSGGG